VVSSGPVTMTEGIGLLDLMLATTTNEELRGVLLAWRDALDEEIDRHPLDSLDLLPHNAVRTEDGSLAFVDSKWAFPGFDRDAILGRAVVNLATWFAVNTSPERWEAETVGELAIHLGALLGLPEPSVWLPEVLAREARLQATVSIPSSEDADLDAHLRRISAESEAFFDTSLRALRGVRPSVLVQEAERLRGQLADSESAIQVLGQQRAALDQEIRAIYATRLFRFSSTPRAVYRRLRGR